MLVPEPVGDGTLASQEVKGIFTWGDLKVLASGYPGPGETSVQGNSSPILSAGLGSLHGGDLGQGLSSPWVSVSSLSGLF